MVYDLIILGAGPGGYIAAERAGAAGKRILLIEKSQLGGVCLNEGCIPSKTLLNSAKLFHYAQNGAAYGVQTDGVRFDLTVAMARKNKVMETLRGGVRGLMKKCKVEVVEGTGRLLQDRRVEVDGTVYRGANLLIATGSSPARPPIPGLDGQRVVDSTGILQIETLPESLVIIGGGVIGCEFACFFGSLGIPVTVIEMLPEICPPVDADIAKALRAELEKKNIRFILGARVENIADDTVTFLHEGKTQTLPRDLLLVCTGRVPNVQNLGLAEAGIEFSAAGIPVDEHCRSNHPGVFAIGDVTGQSWLAHGASRMGEVVVNNLLGRPDRMRYHAIPGVVYTNPEVASVGLTAAKAEVMGYRPIVGRLPLTSNGRYLAEHDGERGTVKVIVDEASGLLLGVHMLGGACSEMIFGAAAMIESEFRVNEIKDLVFPHPTTSEVLRDALFTLPEKTA